MAKVDEDFGDLGTDFLSWWRGRGMELFQEDGVPLIKVLKPDSPDDAELKREHGVFIVVPMTISRELILEQFGIMLDIHHPGSELKRHEHSTGQEEDIRVKITASKQ
jgi:hypothetical protein